MCTCMSPIPPPTLTTDTIKYYNSDSQLVCRERSLRVSQEIIFQLFGEKKNTLYV